jgi:AraC family transcriptional regulator of arabinose operon
MDNLTEDKKKVKEGFVGQRMIVLPPDVKKVVVKNPLIKGLYLTAVGYYPRASQHDRERKAGCPQYILLYCVDGSGYIHIGKKKHILKPNTYFIIPKGVPHHYGTDKTDPWSIYWVHFGGENASLLYARYTREVEVEVQFIPYYEHRIELFNLILSLLESNYSIRNIELTNLVLLEFLSSFIYNIELYPSYYTADHINSSIEFMKENLDKTYSIQELADRLFYSVSHYSDLFKKKTGFSPIRYFNQLKIQKSCQYLYFTDMNIKEICGKVGIEDPYYFSRMFKNLMGLSPAKYRSTHKK